MSVISANFFNSESGKLIVAAKAGDALSLIAALNVGADKDALIYNVAYDATVNPKKLANPMPFNGLSRLLVYMSGRARLAMSQGWQDMLPGEKPYQYNQYNSLTLG